MYYIALRMLFGDRAKYLILLCALSFSTLLITQQGSIFLGLLRWATALMRNSKAEVWVVDPKVEQINDPKPMRTTELNIVRSVDGVDWAMPILFTIIQARLPSGYFKQVQLIGLDSSTLAGLPKHITHGNPLDLFQDEAVIIDQVGIEKLSEDPKKPIGVGCTFEINDHTARIVALCNADRSFFGYPYVYTTFERAARFMPPQRNVLSYIMVKAKEGYTPEQVARRIELETGLKAYTEQEFSDSTITWFFKNTGIPISFGTTVILGFLVGIAVAGQTFYSFILENMPNFGALKAMGVTDRTLAKMMMVQAATVGVMGYGFGMAFTGIFGWLVIERGNPPFYLPYSLILAAFIAVMAICLFSVFLGIRKISSIEPAQVFRA